MRIAKKLNIAPDQQQLAQRPDKLLGAVMNEVTNGAKGCDLCCHGANRWVPGLLRFQH
jgi:hypothetical protein